MARWPPWPTWPCRCAAAAVKQDIDIYLKSLGTVTAYSTVTVRSRVSGELVDVPFKEGQMVKAGDLLAQVDPRAFQVALAQAQGTQMQNLAQLENARRDLQRYQALYTQDSIAKQQVDTQAALVRQYEGAVKSDQANVDNAKLQLDYSRITAPISGRLGLRRGQGQPGVQFRHQWPGGHHPDPAHLRGVHAARDPTARSAGRAGGRPHADRGGL